MITNIYVLFQLLIVSGVVIFLLVLGLLEYDIKNNALKQEAVKYGYATWVTDGNKIAFIWNAENRDK